MGWQRQPPATRRFVDGVRAVASAAPSSTAIVDDGPRAVSYGRFVADVDAAGQAMRAAGVLPGHTAIVHARRVRRLPVALLSLWDLGATAAIVDATMPPDRLDVCAQVVGARWRVLMDADEPITVAPARGAGVTGPAGATPPAPTGSPRSHVLFTSGTTGRPAAVEIGPDALWRAFQWYFRTFGPGPGDRVALLAGCGHDPVLRDILVPLMSGGTLVVPPADVFDRPNRILSFLQRSRISILHCTPALLEVVLAARPPEPDARLDDLRLVVSAGAPLRLGTVRGLRAVTDALIVNAYGSTETPQIASCETVGPVDAGRPDAITLPVGTGAGDTRLLLADAAGRVEAGARGEIVVRGPNLAIGYVAHTGPDERFVADPLGVPGFRGYRTGDIGERDDTGSIRIVGRMDREISLHGFRLAVEEIEDAALRHPSVARAVAELVTGPAGDSIRLAVVPEPGRAADPAAIRAFLRSRLPRYAVPARIQIVDALPLSRNHKVNAPPR
jgi:acyl-coenzyme A synthetase/AMP-(fatty) acid ligase